MTNDSTPFQHSRLLIAIPPREAAELVALALNMTNGRVRQASIARGVNSALADRLLEYFAASGVVLMRPPPGGVLEQRLRHKRSQPA